MSPALAGGLTTAPPGKSHVFCFLNKHGANEVMKRQAAPQRAASSGAASVEPGDGLWAVEASAHLAEGTEGCCPVSLSLCTRNVPTCAVVPPAVRFRPPQGTSVRIGCVSRVGVPLHFPKGGLLGGAPAHRTEQVVGLVRIFTCWWLSSPAHL